MGNVCYELWQLHMNATTTLKSEEWRVIVGGRARTGLILIDDWCDERKVLLSTNVREGAI